MGPHGIDDLVNGIIRPTRAIEGRMHVYHRRITAKNWRQRWPGLTVVRYSPNWRVSLSPSTIPVASCCRGNPALGMALVDDGQYIGA